MTSREKFEAWYLENWGCTEDNLDSLFEESPHGNEYYRFGVRLAWQAWQAATKQSEAKCAALAAENAGLKAAHPQPFGPVMMKALDAYEKHQDDVPETGMLDAFFILRDSIRVDTTSTDAFLAEVRAQGVEMFAAILHRKGDDAFFDAIAEAQANAADQFAAQIRKGVQS